ncbi:MAG TPA: hypothetical protein DCP47_07670 [Phycisphaerales bacterium]|nr:hypothetical protein [Phycisphaerales bacterium]
MEKRLAKKIVIYKGFTLIELLVVISIIAMMLSILTPALSRAKEQAKRIECFSNLKQLTLAWSMYAMNNSDKLCSPDVNCGIEDGCWVIDGPALPGNWIGGTELAIKKGVLWPYTQYIKLYGCPTAGGYESPNVRNDRLRDYMIPVTMGFTGQTWYGQPCSTFKRYTAITRPLDKLAFVEADGGLRGATGNYWLLNAFWPLNDESSEPQWKFDTNSERVPCNMITARHDKGFNMSFADGHCGYYKYKDQRTVKLAVELLDFYCKFEKEASVDNPDLDYMGEILKGPK